MEYKYNDLLKDKRAVLFDLDGTLVDSMWVWRNIDIDFLSAIGKELPDDLQKEIEGMSFTEPNTLRNALVLRTMWRISRHTGTEWLMISTPQRLN